MIDIEAVLDENGILRSCKASGHAGAGKTGSDIVCAAVSVLMRTAVRVLSNRKGVTVRYEVPEPGLLFLEADYTSGRDFLSAVGVFLIEGIASVVEEYPNNCRLTIRRT